MSLDYANLNALYKFCEQSPGDSVCYQAIADLLQEGGWRSLSHAFFWMAKRNRFPHKRANYCGQGWVQGRKVPQASRWAWYSKAAFPNQPITGVLPKADRNLHWLPHLLLRGPQKVFLSHQAAVMFLAAQLQILKNEYDLEPHESALLINPEIMEMVKLPSPAEIIEDET